MTTISTAFPTGASATSFGRSRRVLDRLAVEFDDEVADLHVGALARPTLVDGRDERAALLAKAERLGDRVVDALHPNAEPAPSRLAELLQLLDHRRHGVRGRREADADRIAGGGEDRRVDPNDLAVHVEHRAAGIAFVDGCVRLDVIVVGTLVDVAVTRRDDALRHRAAETEGIADREHPIADARLVAVAEFDGLQRLLGLHAQHRNVDLRVLADDLRLELLPVREVHGDLVGVGDHMIVGDDDPRRVDDEAGAHRAVAFLRGLGQARIELLLAPQEFVEILVERRRVRVRLRNLAALRLDDFRGNVHDGVRDFRREVGERFGASRRGRRERERKEEQRRGKGGLRRKSIQGCLLGAGRVRIPQG